MTSSERFVRVMNDLDSQFLSRAAANINAFSDKKAPRQSPLPSRGSYIQKDCAAFASALSINGACA